MLHGNLLDPNQIPTIYPFGTIDGVNMTKSAIFVTTPTRPSGVKEGATVLLVEE